VDLGADAAMKRTQRLPTPPLGRISWPRGGDSTGAMRWSIDVERTYLVAVALASPENVPCGPSRRRGIRWSRLRGAPV